MKTFPLSFLAMHARDFPICLLSTIFSFVNECILVVYVLGPIIWCVICLLMPVESLFFDAV